MFGRISVLVTMLIVAMGFIGTGVSPVNAADILSWALALNLETLKVQAKAYIRERLGVITKTKGFTDLMRGFPDALEEEKEH